MRLKFITNAVYVDKDGTLHEINSGDVVNISNEESAKGYVERGTAVEEGSEDTISDQYRATFQPSPVDVALTNSGSVTDVSEKPVDETGEETPQEGVELQ